MLQECSVYRLGRLEYEQAWQMQTALAAQIAAGARPPTLLLLEHPHTYTFGRRGKQSNLLWDDAELAHRGITVHWVDRGGDVTYHGPGQLVGYPLIPLAPGGLRIPPGSDSPRIPQADYVGYLRRLEEMLILALARLGLSTMRLPGLTGVWVSATPRPAKVAALGVKVDVHSVSRHGFALNVNPDMSFWQGIVACGLADYAVTCLAEWLQPAPTLEQTMDAVTAAFGEIFHYRMITHDSGVDL
jgi:lipoyl(octanoyl) transferase